MAGVAGADVVPRRRRRLHRAGGRAGRAAPAVRGGRARGRAARLPAPPAAAPQAARRAPARARLLPGPARAGHGRALRQVTHAGSTGPGPATTRTTVK